MPRCLIECSFPQGSSIPLADDGKKTEAGVVANNAEQGATRAHSRVQVATPQAAQTLDAGRRGTWDGRSDRTSGL